MKYYDEIYEFKDIFMKWFDDAIGKLEKERIYTRKELIAIIQANYPHVGDNSCNWAIADMIKDDKIVKVGYNKWFFRKH